MTDFKIELWPIEQIKPYENNVKIHTEEQISKIAESIKKFGWDQPIVVDKNGVIIKGHGRTLAAKHLGLKVAPVLIRSDLTDDEVKAARIADNRVAMGDIDVVGLQEELRQIDMDLDGIFDAKELKFLDVDLTEINQDMVEKNIVQEMERRDDEISENIAVLEDKDVRIGQALGFTKIKGRDQRPVARFMARIEGETGLIGAEAFIAFTKNYISKE